MGTNQVQNRMPLMELDLNLPFNDYIDNGEQDGTLGVQLFDFIFSPKFFNTFTFLFEQ